MREKREQSAVPKVLWERAKKLRRGTGLRLPPG